MAKREVVTIEHMCSLFMVNPASVRRWCQTKKVKAKKIGHGKYTFRKCDTRRLLMETCNISEKEARKRIDAVILKSKEPPVVEKKKKKASPNQQIWYPADYIADPLDEPIEKKKKSKPQNVQIAKPNEESSGFAAIHHPIDNFASFWCI